jgi:anthranilate phosphoribosyltransferase
VPDLKAGIGVATETIASGAATDLLARLRAAKTARDAARMEVAPA